MKNKVRLYRHLRGEMTQEELARHAAVTRQTIIAVEKGKYNPSVKLALLIASALGARVEDLFILDEER